MSLGRVAMVADSIVCEAGGVGLLTSRRFWNLTSLPAPWRIPTSLMLIAFAIFIGQGSLIRQPWPDELRTAACLNAGWTLAGAASVRYTSTRLGRQVVLLVVAADFLLALVQWSCSKRPG